MSLPEHLVDRRPTLAEPELRLKGHLLGQETLHHPVHCQVKGGCYLCEAEKQERRNV